MERDRGEERVKKPNGVTVVKLTKPPPKPERITPRGHRYWIGKIPIGQRWDNSGIQKNVDRNTFKYI